MGAVQSSNITTATPVVQTVGPATTQYVVEEPAMPFQEDILEEVAPTSAIVSEILPAPTEVVTTPVTYTLGCMNLSEYMGKWYEIASSSKLRRKGATTDYTLLNNGTIEIVNNSYLPDGRINRVTAIAAPISTDGRVWEIETGSLSGPATYQILDYNLAEGYSIIINPNTGHVSILSREACPSITLYHKILSILAPYGYDINSLSLTDQGCCQ